jgi:hypothetical protein
MEYRQGMGNPISIASLTETFGAAAEGRNLDRERGRSGAELGIRSGISVSGIRAEFGAELVSGAELGSGISVSSFCCPRGESQDQCQLVLSPRVSPHERASGGRWENKMN